MRRLFFLRAIYEVEIFVPVHEPGLNERSAINKIVAAYPVGKLVRVFYDGANPTDAVIEPGLSTSTLIMTWMAGGL